MAIENQDTTVREIKPKNRRIMVCVHTRFFLMFSTLVYLYYFLFTLFLGLIELVSLILNFGRVLEDLMMMTIGGHHGCSHFWKKASLFNASYMLILTRVNVICIVWIVWMVLSVLSVSLTIRIIVLSRFVNSTFCTKSDTFSSNSSLSLLRGDTKIHSFF